MAIFQKKDYANRITTYLFSIIPRLCKRKDYSFLTRLVEQFTLWVPFAPAPYEYILRSLVSRREISFALGLHRKILSLIEKSGEPEVLKLDFPGGDPPGFDKKGTASPRHEFRLR